MGDVVPEFELPGAGEDGIELFSLSEFTREGALVVSFYPFDFSPVCTNHLCCFRDAEWLGITETVDVVGISVDSAYAHRRFRDEYDLPFPLLSDRDASVASDLGVRYDRWEDHPAVCQRSLFAIDDEQTIRYRWHAGDATEQPGPGELEAAIGWL